MVQTHTHMYDYTCTHTQIHEQSVVNKINQINEQNILNNINYKSIDEKETV